MCTNIGRNNGWNESHSEGIKSLGAYIFASHDQRDFPSTPS